MLTGNGRASELVGRSLEIIVFIATNSDNEARIFKREELKY